MYLLYLCLGQLECVRQIEAFRTDHVLLALELRFQSFQLLGSENGSHAFPFERCLLGAVVIWRIIQNYFVLLKKKSKQNKIKITLFENKIKLFAKQINRSFFYCITYEKNK